MLSAVAMQTISFVTLSRSDYASMRPVVRAALGEVGLRTLLIAGGSHLLARHGRSIEQIRGEDGLPVDAVADFMRESDDTPAELAAAYARAVEGFVGILGRQSPDKVFVLGDRWEMLAVATAASLLQIPIVHHSGGDITQGSADNQTRYALTALAHLHLVALPRHRERLLRMGEESWRVIVTGEPALTTLDEYAASVPDVHSRLGLRPGEPFVLATFHPTSFDARAPREQVEVFLHALDAIPEAIVLTAPNPDPASELFMRSFDKFASARPRVRLHASLGARLYYAAMAHARFMVGNSSSGLWEAPSFRLPVVNVGPRQQGREHGDNVVHCGLDEGAVAAAVAQVRGPAFRAALSGRNPYVRTDTLELILQSLKAPHDRGALLAKRFVDPLAGA